MNPTQAVAAESVNPEPAGAESAEPITPLETMPAAVAATAAAIAVESAATVAPIREAQPAMAPAAARWRRPPEPEPDDSFEIGDHDRRLVDDLAAAANDSSARWTWGVGALVLALLLAVQLTHHNRLQLARNATVGPALREVYSSLDMPLPPNWNLAAFELRQWGANESSPSAAGYDDSACQPEERCVLCTTDAACCGSNSKIASVVPSRGAISSPPNT